jgi:3-methyladenine DNA glycosylase AlkD
MKKILDEIRRELLKNVDESYKIGSKNFFKEKINPIGVRSACVKKIAREKYREVCGLSKCEIFDLAEKLMGRGTMEETAIALNWLYRRRSEYDASDFSRFESWLKRFVTNWAHCDDFCTHAFGYLVNKYPNLVEKTVTWRASRSRWLRRASAVILIHPWFKPNPFLKEIFETADALLTDGDDLVQKGYGWMLKVAADFHRDEVYSFILARKNKMPRTALRYAIEKMTAAQRKKLMSR